MLLASLLLAFAANGSPDQPAETPTDVDAVLERLRNRLLFDS